MRYSSFCRSLLFLFVCLSLGTLPGTAQTTRYYTAQVISALNTANATAATGADPATQATLMPPAAFGKAALRLGFGRSIPVGSKAGLKMNSGGVLVLAAFTGMVINTYLSPNETPQQSISVSQLLTLELLNKGEKAAEFTVTKPFDHIELAASGLLNAYSLGLAYVYADVTGPLPVGLVAFGGQATAAGVQLSWQTATEANNAYFAVERAPAGQATSFVELGRVAGSGSSNVSRRYQFTDAAPGAGGYYRLRQVDTDGQAHYSPVVVVVRSAAEDRLSVYPSPATTTLQVASATTTRLVLYTMRGELVRQYEAATGQQTLDVSALPTGIYYLRDAATGQSVRFVKAAGQ